MSDPNPYAAPKTPEPDLPVRLSEDTCPSCKSSNVHRPGFTWWGGAIGPKLLSHAVCRGCGLGFNYKTGKLNTTAIAVYTIIVFVVVILIYAALRM